MAHVFISYSSTDRDIAQALATELETNNLSVWWDFRLVGGQTFRKAIDQELNAAWAVVVIWSESSVESRFVIDEAEDPAPIAGDIALLAGLRDAGKLAVSFDNLFVNQP